MKEKNESVLKATTSNVVTPESLSMIGGNGSIFTSGQNQPRLSVANLDSLLKPEKKELEFLKPVLESQSAISDNHSGVDIFAKDKPAPT